jgi:hypothetical protein
LTVSSMVIMAGERNRPNSSFVSSRNQDSARFSETAGQTNDPIE